MTSPPAGRDTYRSRIKPGAVIDMHVHLVGVDRERGNHVSPRLKGSLLHRFLQIQLGLHKVEDHEVDMRYLDMLNTFMAEPGAPDHLVLLPLDWAYDEHGNIDEKRSHLVASNEAVFAACDQNEKLLPAGSVNPMRKDAMEALEQMAERGALFLKLLPNVQHFDPSEDRFRPFFARVAELGLPIVSHTGHEHALPGSNDELGNPVKLIPALEQGCTVIAAHCAAAGTFHRVEYFDRFVGLLPRFERLYGDISGFASPIRGHYLWPMLTSARRRARILYGSDFPVPSAPLVFVKQLGFRKARQLTKDPNPFRRNLSTFRELGLDDDIFTRCAKMLLEA